MHKFYYRVIQTKVDKEIRFQVNFFKTSDPEFLKKQQYKLHYKYEEVNTENEKWVIDFITIFTKSKNNENIILLVARILKGEYDADVVMGELV